MEVSKEKLVELLIATHMDGQVNAAEGTEPNQTDAIAYIHNQIDELFKDKNTSNGSMLKFKSGMAPEALKEELIFINSENLKPYVKRFDGSVHRLYALDEIKELSKI